MNKTEQEFITSLDQTKYKVLRKGYPDFILVHRKTGRIVFVEVKREKQTKELSRGQKETLFHMCDNELTCCLWTPKMGLITLNKEDLNYNDKTCSPFEYKLHTDEPSFYKKMHMAAMRMTEEEDRKKLYKIGEKPRGWRRDPPKEVNEEEKIIEEEDNKNEKHIKENDRLPIETDHDDHKRDHISLKKEHKDIPFEIEMDQTEIDELKTIKIV